MQVIVSGRHLKVRQSIKEEIVAAMQQLDNLSLKINRSEVTVTFAHKKMHVEILMRGKKLDIEAQHESDGVLKSFWLAYEKIQSQLTRHTQKLQDHKGIHIAELDLMAQEQMAKPSEYYFDVEDVAV